MYITLFLDLMRLTPFPLYKKLCYFLKIKSRLIKVWINLQAYQLTKNLARLHLLVTKMEGFLKIVILLRDEILLLVVDEQIVLEETQTVCKPYPNRLQFYVIAYHPEQ